MFNSISITQSHPKTRSTSLLLAVFDVRRIRFTLRSSASAIDQSEQWVTLMLMSTYNWSTSASVNNNRTSEVSAVSMSNTTYVSLIKALAHKKSYLLPEKVD